MLLEEARSLFEELIAGRGFNLHPVIVKARGLRPEEAIGKPRRDDFALVRGKEVMMEAEFEGAYGQAFTSSPGDYEGTLDDVLGLHLEDDFRRAVFIATLNAVMAHLGLIRGTRHCKDEAPELCGREIAALVQKEHPGAKVGIVGYQPALLENLIRAFGPAKVRVTDLNPANVGKVRFGVEVWDGAHRTGELIAWADVLLVTGTTLVNGSADHILSLARKKGIEPIFYGVTAAGIAHLLGLRRVCPCSES
ncbi:MAG: hypothetical protein DRI61_07875 [Chloroflexi bacterium]|nr:MAG: hypothetical protein DRI61_07875 [Chloroflexota bacterium]HDN79695.1 hypothetical protein [Chloroflexota bacterium]